MTHCTGCHSDDDTPSLRAGSVELDRRKEDDGKWKMETLAAWTMVQNAIRAQETVSDGRWHAGRVEKNCIDIQRCTGPH